MSIERKGREAVSSLVDREGRQQQKQQLLLQQFYVYYIKQLMAKEGLFALEDFLTLKRACEDELGGLRRKAGRKLEGLGMKRFGPAASAEAQQLQQEIEILECLSPSELSLCCASALSPFSRKAVAAAAGVSLKKVEELLLQFATMQGDRTWFMRLLEMRRPLPGSFEDRHLLAETDRPYELRLPYGEKFYNYEVEKTRRLLGMRGDGRGDYRRYKNERKLAIRCRLYHPKPRLWRDRWLFFGDFFADPYSNFAARRQYLQQQRLQQQQQQQQQQQRQRLQPLPKGVGIKRKRTPLDELHAAFVRRLPQHDPELLQLLQQAAAAEQHKRLLLTGEKTQAAAAAATADPNSSSEGPDRTDNYFL
ncbi:hypothetical protein, conserved [Eimeria necatrix]|uniref:Uncharacterized protein n=1 Tax=Eimeria necatrix TaxID=51315 RepID=U6MSV7_9EIME|nr:hypothetical protein, conserved [Eimeria necatrix]CDJ67091.1 hypothetical protein, conserved [Eimeria necatrix]